MKFLIFIFLLSILQPIFAQELDRKVLPVRGLAIAAPNQENLERFVKFIDEELAPNGINTLVLRIDYRYQYKSHPELVAEGALSEAQVKSIVKVCKEHDIAIVPQINLLGHQSWHSEASMLLQVYPQFDETPSVKLPENYEWPNEDKLYCKSYCPLHPEVHSIVFPMVDEITEVFEADAFHAGMDEVFYIGEDECPRCSGRDKAELFAGELTKIRNHLAASGKRLWIWGDRLIDGKETGIGMWEASMNNTHQAIDLIPKDVFICDWHYERVDPTAILFAAKGFDVVTCPWRNASLAEKQWEQTLFLREAATETMSTHFQGMMQTVWTSAGNFMDLYYGVKPNTDTRGDQAACFKSLLQKTVSMKD
jgi:hypothetical protein